MTSDVFFTALMSKGISKMIVNSRAKKRIIYGILAAIIAIVFFIYVLELKECSFFE